MNKHIERASWENSIEHHPNYDLRNDIMIILGMLAVEVFCLGVLVYIVKIVK